MEPLLVRAARLEPTERTPVWFMRQAGRSLPEYREIRKTHTLFEVCYEPELCAEVTLQPVRRHDVDAAVMFADIVLPVLSMGVEVELVENVGPVVREPIRSRADVERLGAGEPDERILEAVRIVRRELRPDQTVVGFCGGPFTVAGYLVEGVGPVVRHPVTTAARLHDLEPQEEVDEAIRIVRRELRDDQGVVGFCGGPFTVAGYLVEGRPSRDYARVKAMMYREPET